MANLEDIIRIQNPQWAQGSYVPTEASYFRRDISKVIIPWIDKHPIVALTGLRRVGKSTILAQIKADLLKTTDPRFILAFSFEKSPVVLDKETLREVLMWYFTKFLKVFPQAISSPIYIFLDEVQYVSYWQDVIKTFYDFSQNIKFFISGSTSLFIKKKSVESLAGRIIEIIVPPLSFNEYLRIKKTGMTLKKNDVISLRFLTGHFEEYLSCGQFPEPTSNDFPLMEINNYLAVVEEKIVEQDIPNVFSVRKKDVLKVMFSYLKARNCQILEYNNLASDLGVEAKIVSRYTDYFRQAYLINFCLNDTKKLVRAERTGKKIYLTSSNFSQTDLPQKVENYVFNWLKIKGEVKFYRYKTFEVDFILTTQNGVLPVEVKYQDTINPADYRNLVKLAKIKNLSRVLLVTKNNQATVVVDGITIDIIPVVLLEWYTPLTPI